MYSKLARNLLRTVFDVVDDALNRGTTLPELISMLETYQRLSRELLMLDYELTSPFGRPSRDGPT